MHAFIHLFKHIQAPQEVEYKRPEAPQAQVHTPPSTRGPITQECGSTPSVTLQEGCVSVGGG